MSRIEAILLGAAVVLSIALGWYVRASTIEKCAELVHEDPALCRSLGGLLDAEADGSTLCVFTCTVPP